MPDWLIGVVGLAVIVGAVVLWQKLMEFLREKANQKVLMRRGHREGEELVSQRWVFTPTASVEDVKRAILSTVKVAPQVPLAIADAHLVDVTDDLILYGYGVKLNPMIFQMALTFTGTDRGCLGTCRFTNWTESGGIVEGRSVMRRLLADINTALRSVDPKATLTPNTATSAVAR